MAADRQLHAWQSRFTGGQSPSTLGLAFTDWAVHAANAPFQSAELLRASFTQWHRLTTALAAEKSIVSEVAGRADILVVPDLETGNMLAKEFTFLAGAEAAGVVLGASVPAILASRADGIATKVASCALGVLMARAQTR